MTKKSVGIGNMSDCNTVTDFLASVALLSGRTINHSMLVPLVLHIREKSLPSQMYAVSEEPVHDHNNSYSVCDVYYHHIMHSLYFHDVTW